MKEKNTNNFDLKFVSSDLIEDIQSFPTNRKVEHCNSFFSVSPFDFYGICPICQSKIKLRASSGLNELEDVFDAVFGWLSNPESQEIFVKRQKEIIEEETEE